MSPAVDRPISIAVRAGAPARSGRRPALFSRRHVDFGRTASAICRA